MRTIFCLFLMLFFASCHPSKESHQNNTQNPYPVIYGEDGRRDFFEVSDARLLEIASSTAVFIENEHLQADQQAQIFKLRHEPPHPPLCPGEKYAEQPQWGFCSGALVAPDVILTAGHCVENEKECFHTKVVFDYRLRQKGEDIKSFKTDQVFNCKEIIHWILEDQGADFALIKLDRPVTGRKILAFSNTKVTFQDSLLVVGFPLGLPLKFTFDGRVRSQLKEKFFVATVDTFNGNSGSPVFNQQTLEIVGVLSRGERDFEKKNSCFVSKVCQGEDCRGEDVTEISEVRKVWTPETGP